MLIPFKKLIFAFAYNSCLFLLLIIGIQNSSKKVKVNLLIDETVKLPIAFIVGTSFISGSILGSLITINLEKK